MNLDWSNKITPDLLFAAIGLTLAIVGIISQNQIGQISQALTIIGMAIMFGGSFLSPLFIEYLSRTTTCISLQRDTDGAAFDTYLDEPPKLVLDSKGKTSHWECKCKYPVIIPGDTYYGAFNRYALTSDIPLNQRASYGPRLAVLFNTLIRHGHVTQLLVQDTEISPSDSFKGERIPAFKVIRAIQGDYEHHIPIISASLKDIISNADTSLAEKFKELLDRYNKVEFGFQQLRHRMKTAYSARLTDDLAGDMEKATTVSLLRHQKDQDTQVKIEATHYYCIEKSWKKVVDSIKDQGTKLKLPPLAIVAIIAIVAVAIVFYSNPTILNPLIIALSNTQNQIFAVTIIGLIAFIVYMVWRHRK